VISKTLLTRNIDPETGSSSEEGELEPSMKIRVEPLNLSDMIEEKQLEETTECNARGKSANALRISSTTSSTLKSARKLC
jgi:hypothetical protein